MRGVRVIAVALVAFVTSAAKATSALAQSSTLRVISGGDSAGVPFAWVAVQGGTASITDEQGKLNLGAAHRKTLTVEVRRIGYQAWIGKIELGDTSAVFTVALPRLAESLGAVTIRGDATRPSALQQTGFYERWMMRQKGTLSATFIGPEEIEKRHPARTSDLLSGVNGVTIVHTPQGGQVAKGNGGTCFMTVLLDGARLCPDNGCKTDADPGNVTQISPTERSSVPIDRITVDLNRYIDASEVTAVEVYSRGGNMPVSLHAADNACGVIAIWTGSRR